MNKHIEVIALVEGKTEEIFINKLIKPWLAEKHIFIRCTQVSKPGQKGGDVRFSRVKRDIGAHLKQRTDTCVTTFIDYYGVKEWPGLQEVPEGAAPEMIAEFMNSATKAKIAELFPTLRIEERFIPFMAIHEFEALLFSDAKILADELKVSVSEIESTLKRCGGPEGINNNKNTAPSKRLDAWSRNGKFAKTTTGITIAERIGIPVMRKECRLFDAWLSQLESMQTRL